MCKKCDKGRTYATKAWARSLARRRLAERVCDYFGASSRGRKINVFGFTRRGLFG